MTIDTKDMLNSILESISRISYIKPEEIPEIHLWRVIFLLQEDMKEIKS